MRRQLCVLNVKYYNKQDSGEYDDHSKRFSQDISLFAVVKFLGSTGLAALEPLDWVPLDLLPFCRYVTRWLFLVIWVVTSNLDGLEV